MKQALEIGTVVGGGRYIIERVLGVGGFGITYYVRHHELGLHYALKEFFISGKCVREGDHNTVMLQDIDPSKFAKLKERFIDEARTLAALSHPHVVKVHDFFNENNTSYIVMDYVEGTTLQQIVETKGKMSFDDAVNCMGQLGEAVAYIHKKHVLHRDIKPENIIITPDNRVVLIDFGSAREFVHDEVQRHTTILTMGYAPIEQYSATSKKGNYTDIYAMGGVFYFLLTGVRPMDVSTRTMEQMKSPRELNPDISEEVSHTIMKAMEFKPEDRYQTVEEFVVDLLGKVPNVMTWQQLDDTGEVSGLEGLSADTLSDSSRKKDGKWGFIFAGLFAATLLATIVVWFNLSSELKRVRYQNDDFQWQLQNRESEIEGLKDRYNTIESQFDLMESRYNTLENQYNEISLKYPLVIESIKVGNMFDNGTMDLSYGSTIYSSQTMYLTPQITYKGFVDRSVSFKVKMFNADGVLCSNTSSPNGYTYSQDRFVYKGNNTIEFMGWGGANRGFWKSGSYRFEIWYDGVMLGSKQFYIY